MSGTDHAWNTVYNVLADHKHPILGVTNRPQLARDIVAALTKAGFDLQGSDFREVELCKVHGIRRCTVCVRS